MYSPIWKLFVIHYSFFTKNGMNLTMTESVVFTKSKAFVLRIVRLYKYLREREESVIAKQMLRSGTSIGANIAESRYAQSKADFIAKF